MKKLRNFTICSFLILSQNKCLQIGPIPKPNIYISIFSREFSWLDTKINVFGHNAPIYIRNWTCSQYLYSCIFPWSCVILIGYLVLINIECSMMSEQSSPFPADQRSGVAGLSVQQQPEWHSGWWDGAGQDHPDHRPHYLPHGEQTHQRTLPHHRTALVSPRSSSSTVFD